MPTTETASSEVTIQNLLEAGLHFGHQTKRWNPKMQRFIFDKRNGIHIIDLAKSITMLGQATAFVKNVILQGRRVLFVGTKKQAQQVTERIAKECGQFYVNTRWLGGTLTNNATIRQRVKRLRELEEIEKTGKFDSMHKKEAARDRHELAKLRRNLAGIADMADLPGALFVTDINREAIAVAEANRLHIPVVAIVDTNCDPDPIDYPIPGNDDAIRAIEMLASAIAGAVKEGSAEYSRKAVEEARKMAEEAKAAEEARKAAEAARKTAAKSAKEAAKDADPADATMETAVEN